MKRWAQSRRESLKTAAMAAGVEVLPPLSSFARASAAERNGSSSALQNVIPADYTLGIKASLIEIAPNRIISMTTYPMMGESVPAAFHLTQGKRYGIRVRNASEDIHPIHLHRNSFEPTSLAGKS
jgi:hypothetical protein